MSVLPLPNKLDPALRAAIDAKIAEGAVQVIPTGVSGRTDEDLIWCPEKNRLQYKDTEAAKARAPGWGSGGRAKTPSDEPKLREGIEQLAEQGKTRDEIAAELGSTARRVGHIATKHGIKIAYASPRGDENREKVRAAFDGKRKQVEIARIVGFSEGTVAKHLSRLGLKAPTGRKGHGPDSPAVIARKKRQERLQSLPGWQHRTLSDLATELGVARSTVSVDRKKLLAEVGDQ